MADSKGGSHPPLTQSPDLGWHMRERVGKLPFLGLHMDPNQSQWPIQEKMGNLSSWAYVGWSQESVANSNCRGANWSHQ